MKNGIIAALGTMQIMEIVPGWTDTIGAQRAAVFFGVFVPLLFFTFFVEKQVEKWKKRHARNKRMARRIRKLKEIKIA